MQFLRHLSANQRFGSNQNAVEEVHKRQSIQTDSTISGHSHVKQCTNVELVQQKDCHICQKTVIQFCEAGQSCTSDTECEGTTG